jgi:hypothetical protein
LILLSVGSLPNKQWFYTRFLSQMGHRLFAVEGHNFIGRYVRKVFNIGPFNGKVVGWRYTKGEYQFRVVFTDNDVLDITEEEVQEGSALFDSSTESSDKDLIDEAARNWNEKRKQVSAKNEVHFSFQYPLDFLFQFSNLTSMILRGMVGTANSTSPEDRTDCREHITKLQD